MDKILRRHLERLTYVTPEDLGREACSVAEPLLQRGKGTKQVKEEKQISEKYQAAQLAFMLKHGAAIEADVTVCMGEADDYEFSAATKSTLEFCKVVTK